MEHNAQTSVPAGRRNCIGRRVVGCRLPKFFFLFLLFTALVLPEAGNATPTASEIMTLAQQQLGAPSEFARGEMKIYRNNRLERTYTFVLGRQWDVATQTESVRIDFQSAVSVELGDSSRYADNRYLLKQIGRASCRERV